MTKTNTSHHRLLYGGGELFINRMGRQWCVDVFALDSEPGDDPIYHMTYFSESEALQDADMWRIWS